MDLSESSKKVNTLISRIFELCEKEGATVGEMRMLISRFTRVAEEKLETLEFIMPFTNFSL